MAHQEPVAAWFAPVYQSLAQPLLTAGVPSGFFIATMLGTLLIAMTWWPSILVQAGVYALARRLTQWDALWWRILALHLTYNRTYEG